MSRMATRTMLPANPTLGSQAFGQGPQRGGGDDVAALDRDELAGGDRRDSNQPGDEHTQSYRLAVIPS
jgi:hypothetical protein